MQTTIAAEIAAYRAMMQDAKEWRDAHPEDASAKLDAIYDEVIVQGDESRLYALAGVRAPANAVAAPASYSSSAAAGRPTPRVTTVKLASDKQVAFLTRLLTERETAHAARLQAEVNSGELTSKKASELITWLLNAPRVTAPTPVASSTPAAPVVTITDGFYELDGTAYKVQLNLAGTKLYGKKLVEGTWEYVAGVVGVLTRGNAQPLSEELAAKLGHLYGTCVICNRRLTDEGSIAKGIGPVCAAKQGW